MDLRSSWMILMALSLSLLLTSCPPAVTTVRSVVVGMAPIGVLSDGSPSRAVGFVTMTSYSNNETVFELQMANLPANSAFHANVRRGICSRIGLPVGELNEVASQASKLGNSKSTLKSSDVAVADLVVVVYQRGTKAASGVGNPISCGEL